MATAPNPLTDLSAIVTDVGLAVASLATPTGPWINIRQFKVADGYGYKAQRTDTGLNGNVLYSNVVSAYKNVPPKTINVMCTIPAIEGPFLFGELGLYIPSNDAPNDPTQDVLFAKLVFPTLQLKTSSLVTNVASSYTFNCLIDLEQSTAVFQINNGELQTIWVVNKWSDVVPQQDMANPAIDLIIVQEPDPYGRSTALTPAQPNGQGLGTQWSPQGTYQFQSTATVAAATTTSVSVSAAALTDWSVLSRSDHTFVIQFASGLFRAVTSVDAIAGGLLRFNLAPDALSTIPATGTGLTIWKEDASQDSLLTASGFGIGHPGNGINVPRPGVFEAYGLLHGAPGTGRVLTTTDSLNSAFPSGEYSIANGNRPSGLPSNTTLGGRLRISNYNGHILQQFFPMWDGNGLTGPNNQAWWRMWNSSSGWGVWRVMGGTSIQSTAFSLTRGQMARWTFPQPFTGIPVITIGAQVDRYAQPIEEGIVILEQTNYSVTVYAQYIGDETPQGSVVIRCNLMASDPTPGGSVTYL